MTAFKLNRLVLAPGGWHKKSFLRTISIAIILTIVIATLLGENELLSGAIAPRVYNYQQWTITVENEGRQNVDPDRPHAKLQIPVVATVAKPAPQFGGNAPDSCQRYTGPEGRELGARLDDLLNLLPEESSHGELTRPLRGAARKELRNLGLRTREYKVYFEAWEALHTVVNGGVASIRDDIIHYIWCEYGQHTGLAGTRALTETTDSYETFGVLLANMTRTLFPWAATSSRDAVSLRAHLRNGGRGIVITAGNEQALYLLTSIRMMRKLGCELPIEIMYLGDEDLGPQIRVELEALPGVVTRDLSRLIDDSGWKLRSYSTKPFALLFSSFREAILVDADVLFFRNPEALFHDPGYVDSGTLFFHDRVLSIQGRTDSVLFYDISSAALFMKDWLRDSLPDPLSETAKQGRFWTGQSIHMQESGVVVVDKWRHFFCLLVSSWLTGPGRDGHKPGETGFYNWFYGDKESYWLGCELAGDEDYFFHEGELAILGSLEEIQPNISRANDISPTSPVMVTAAGSGRDQRSSTVYNHDVTICAPQILHLDREGSPLWMNGWILQNKFDKENQQLVNFSNFMIEPSTLTEPESWQLKGQNMACLTGNKIYNFTAGEKDLIEDIVETAFRAGSYIPPGGAY